MRVDYAAQDGMVLHWDCRAGLGRDSGQPFRVAPDGQHLAIVNMLRDHSLPVSSIHTYAGTLAVASDNEAFTVLSADS